MYIWSFLLILNLPFIMRTTLFTTGIISLFSLVINAQSIQKLPEYNLKSTQTEQHLRFLASDELMGRKTGEIGNQIAARYIAEQFRLLGAKPAANGSFLQPVALETITPPASGYIQTFEGRMNINDDFILMSGDGFTADKVEIVYLPYAWVDKDTDYNDYKDIDVKGKLIVTSVGFPGANTPQQMFSALAEKSKIAKEKGALALIEVFNSPMPWRNITSYFGRKSTKIKSNDTAEIPHIWISSAAAKYITKDKVSTASVQIATRKSTPLKTANVIGILEGTDPKLKDEYVVLSAHYDHVGYGATQGKITPTDSIFNGARDNAFGTTALLAAAQAFSQQATKRSILLIAYTGEEIGLLGSRFYAENPVIPLEKCVYNLNCDGAGYNDTSLLTVIGLNRTSAKNDIVLAAQAFGLKAQEDTAPEQNLFDRSDNVSLAAKGIPAPTFSPGFTAFDEVINTYYHQVADNPDSIDFGYLLKYCQAYTYAARLIANKPQAPTWTPGDKYQKAFENLFKK